MADRDDLLADTTRVRSALSDDVATKLSSPDIDEGNLVEEEIIDSTQAFEDSADLVGVPSTEGFGDSDLLDVFGESLGGGGSDLLTGGQGSDDLTALDGDRGDTSGLLDGFGSDEPDFISGDETSTMAAGLNTTLTGFGHSITVGTDGVTTGEADEDTFGMSVSAGGIGFGVETGDDGTTISGSGGGADIEVTFPDDGTSPTGDDTESSSDLTGTTGEAAGTPTTDNASDDGSGTDLFGVSGSVAGFGVGVSFNTETGADITLETGETDNTGGSVTVAGVTVTAGDDPTPSDTSDTGDTGDSTATGDDSSGDGSDGEDDDSDDGSEDTDTDADTDDDETVDSEDDTTDAGFTTGEEGEHVIDVEAAMKRVEVIGDSRVQPSDDGEGGGGSGDDGPLLQERLDGGDIDPLEDDGSGVDTEIDTGRIFNTVQPRFGNDDAGVPTIGGIIPEDDGLSFEATTAFETDDVGLDDADFEVGQESGDDAFDFDVDGV